MRIDASKSDLIRFLNRSLVAVDGWTNPAETKQPKKSNPLALKPTHLTNTHKEAQTPNRVHA